MFYFIQVSNDTLVKSPRRIWKQVENKPNGASYVKIFDDIIDFRGDPQYDRRMEFWKNLFE